MAARILVTLETGGLAVLNAHTGALVTAYKGSSAASDGVCFVGGSRRTPSSTSFVAVPDQKRPFLHFYRRERPTAPVYTFALPEKLRTLAFSGCGTLCFASGPSGNVYCWHMHSGCLLRCWKAHLRGVTEMALSPDSTVLVTAGGEGAVQSFSVADIVDPAGSLEAAAPMAIESWTGHRLGVIAMDVAWIDSDDFLVCTVGSEGTISVWRPGCQQAVRQFVLPQIVGAPTSLVCNPVTMSIYVGCNAGPILEAQISDLADPFVLRWAANDNISSSGFPLELNPANCGFIAHDSPVTGLSCSFDGLRLFSCSSDGVRTWDCSTRQTVARVQNLHERPTSVLYYEETDQPQQPQGKKAKNWAASRLQPPAKAFMRTWDNLARPPLVICSRARDTLQTLTEQLLPHYAADKLFSSDALTRQWTERVKALADSVQVDDAMKRVESVLQERRVLQQSVTDLLSTVMELPAVDYGASKRPRTEESISTTAISASSSGVGAIPPEVVPYYRSALYDTDEGGDDSGEKMRFPSAAGRLLTYFDRTFVSVKEARPPYLF